MCCVFLPGAAISKEKPPVQWLGDREVVGLTTGSVIPKTIKLGPTVSLHSTGIKGLTWAAAAAALPSWIEGKAIRNLIIWLVMISWT